MSYVLLAPPVNAFLAADEGRGVDQSPESLSCQPECSTGQGPAAIEAALIEANAWLDPAFPDPHRPECK
jgi:hypothetical protein